MKKQALLITGAAGGLGEELCRKFYKEYMLILLDKKAQPKFIDDLLKDRGQIEYFSVDLNSKNKIKEIKNYLLSKEIYIKGLILAAGIMCFKSFHDITLEDWQETIDINLTSNFLICKEFVPILIQQRFGYIVIIGSVLGKVASYDLFAYNISKAALIHFTKNLALELLEYNILVNCICPGFMQSGMYKNVVQKNAKSKNWFYLFGGLPKKVVSKKDVCKLVDYLINQDSMTGEEIILDGGYSIR